MEEKQALEQELRVLLVEDNPGDRDLILEHLGVAGGFEVETASTLDEARKRLAEGEFDLVLLDLMLPDSQGLDTLRRLREEVDLPIVVLTGLEDEVLGLEAVKAGAQDYLVKGRVGPDSLARALRYALERERFIRKRETGVINDFSSPVETTARLYGAEPLRESSPELFSGLAEEYRKLVELSLERRLKRLQYDPSDQLKELAERLGRLGAGPRDVVEIHQAALQATLESTPPLKVSAYFEEGRYLLLELMGYLVSFYRRYFMGRAASSLPRKEGK